jgi:hypothetical protein
MPTLKTEFACSLCEKQTGKQVQILATEGRLICPENSNHRWTDTADFYASNPKLVFKVGPAKFPSPEGQTTITLKIPQRIKDALDGRYATGLESVVANVLLQLVDGDVMVVGETDKNRLFEQLGQNFTNSSELVGVVWAKMCEVDEAKAEAQAATEDLKAYESRSPGRIVVDLGDEYEPAKERAKNSEPPMPLKMFIEEKLRMALKENWF